jgi:hypothetical protein
MVPGVGKAGIWKMLPTVGPIARGPKPCQVSKLYKREQRLLVTQVVLGVVGFLVEPMNIKVRGQTGNRKYKWASSGRKATGLTYLIEV